MHNRAFLINYLCLTTIITSSLRVGPDQKPGSNESSHTSARLEIFEPGLRLDPARLVRAGKNCGSTRARSGRAERLASRLGSIATLVPIEIHRKVRDYMTTLDLCDPDKIISPNRLIPGLKIIEKGFICNFPDYRILC